VCRTAAQATSESKRHVATLEAKLRRAQWWLDFIAAENSMGFHASQEAARVLGEAIDYARQGEVVLLRGAKEDRAVAAGR
jgi:nitrite reductase (cytochrome c-552)